MSSKSSKSVIKAITLCGERYGFNISEALEMLNSCKGNGVSKSGSLKCSFALPYNGELNENWCLGLNRNSGVYSQCSKKRESDKYCSQCLKEALKNSHCLPNYGNIVDRQKAYLNKEEFKDPSGKSPVAYTKIMKKLKLTEEQVRNECEKMGVTLDPINLEEKTLKKSGRPKQIKPEKPAKEIKAKGRPKKSKKVLELAGEEEDLFASLVMSSLVSSTSHQQSSTSHQQSSTSAPNVSVPKEEEIVLSVNEAKENVSETNVSETKKVTKEKKSSPAKEEKELAKLKEKEAKEEKAKEKIMKSTILKLEKEKQKEELLEKKAALELEKVKAKELLAKKTKVSKKSEVKEVVATSVANLDAEGSDEEADVVKKIVFEGKKYLKSKNTGVIYNMDQDQIGKWNEEKQRIDFNEEEESEDEYDEDC